MASSPLIKNKQQLIWASVPKMIAQGRGAYTTKHEREVDAGVAACAYKTSKGLKCAIGILIHEDDYNPVLEGALTSDVLRAAKVDVNLLNFALELQYCHDTLEDTPQDQFVRMFTQEVESLCLRHNLLMPHEHKYKVGDRLETINGDTIMVVKSNWGIRGYESFQGSDGIWRYDRAYMGHECEDGRVTGCPCWPPYKNSIASGHPLRHPRKVMDALASMPDFWDQTKGDFSSKKLIREICLNMDELFEKGECK